MGGLEADCPNDSKKGTSSTAENVCKLCKCLFREPFSGPCKHPACKSCLAVSYTRNLPPIDEVRCASCECLLKLQELKPDQTVLKRLQKLKNVKCKNCNFRGSYNDFIQNHESKCGGIVRVQCKVFGCGKWLPKDKALEHHRDDKWCPMIVVMTTRLSNAEIVHLSMRESWEWTCGLVLRSDKGAVRKLFDRLVQVFSVLDPKVPVALEDDVYSATKVDEFDSGHPESCHPSADETKTSPVDVQVVTSNGLTAVNSKASGLDEVDGLSYSGSGSSDASVVSAGAAGPKASPLPSPLTNGLDVLKPLGDCDSSPVGLHDQEVKYQLSHDSGATVREKELPSRAMKEINMVKGALGELIKQVDDLIMMPRALAAIGDRLLVFEGVLATFHRDLEALPSRGSAPNNAMLEKMIKSVEDMRRSLPQVVQSIQRLETRLTELELSHTGVFLWKIDNYTKRKQEAQTTSVKSLYSVPFFTSQYGYKLCGRVFLMGDGVGKGTHISLFLTIMKGPYDAALPWPFREKITFQLVNQTDPINRSIVEAFRPDPASSSFKRPTSERNIGAGCPLFAKIQVSEDPKQGFLKENTLYLKIISQTVDVPDTK